MSIHLRLLRQARQAGAALALTILFGFLGGLLLVGQGRMLSHLITRVFLDGQGLTQVQPVLTGLLVIFGLRAALTAAGEFSAAAVAVRVKENIRHLLAGHLFQLGPAYTQGEQSGELTAAVVQGVEALDAYFSQYLPQIVLAALVPLTILVWVFPLDLLSAVVLLVTAPLIPIFMALIGKASEAMTRRQWTALSRMSAYLLDTLQGLTALKLLGQSKARTARIGDVSERYRQATMTVLRVTFLSALVLELVATLSTAVVAVEIGLRVLYGRLGFEQAFFILIIAPEFYLPLRQLGARFHAGMSGVSAARRIFEVLDQPLPVRGTAAPAHAFAELRLDEVHFTYPQREQAALNGFSLTLCAGQQVALVGSSGAGKSTVAQLLLGFITPQSGQILVDGRPLGELSPEQWRRQIAWVPQQPFLFQDSVIANIRLGRPEATLEEVRTAARLAHFDAVAAALPQGYDTLIGERGARLSGGQAQRLALARAFLRDAPLLILDEPTAHLDPEQEALLEEATHQLCRGRTALIIAHRLATIYRADSIALVEDGRVVEYGSHAGLLARNGRYAHLVRRLEGGA